MKWKTVISAAMAAALSIQGLACGSRALAAPLGVESVDVTKTTDNYTIDVHYPKTGLAAIDRDIGDWATGLINGFVTQGDEDFASFAKDDGDRPPWTYSLDLSYNVSRNDDSMFVVDFDESTFTGGAHPNHDIETFNFLVSDGWRVFLPEILDRNAVNLISELAIAGLRKQWDGATR